MSPWMDDLLCYAIIFGACWVLFLATHFTASALGLIRGAGKEIVVLAIVAAIAIALASWLLFTNEFSSTEVHFLASITAPICFLGFCGIYILVGPVTVDRSITMTMLRSLKIAATKGVRQDKLMAAMPFNGIFHRRLHELAAAGIIKINDVVRITPRGELFLRAYVWLGRRLNIPFHKGFAGFEDPRAVRGAVERKSFEDLIINSIINFLPVGVVKRLPAYYYAINRWRFRLLRRPRMVKETSKARDRRVRDGFFNAYFNGTGLDIGYGGDLVVPNCRGWDVEDGDAHVLDGIPDNAFDFIYSSHLLEHLEDPARALRRWWRALKPGGYLILYVPDRDLFERKRNLPSDFSLDHKHFFTVDDDDPPDTIGLKPLLSRELPDCTIVYAKICDCGQRADEPAPSMRSKAEYSIEVVARKPAS